MSIEDEAEAAKMRAYDLAREAIVSPDKKTAMRGRFARDAYLPLVEWLIKEMERCPSFRHPDYVLRLADVAEIATSGLGHTLAVVLNAVATMSGPQDSHADAAMRQLGVDGFLKSFDREWNRLRSSRR